MSQIVVEAITYDGKTYKFQVESWSQSIAMLKFRRGFNKWIEDLEKRKLSFIKKQFTFRGNWDYRMLNPLTKELDKNNITWWLDP